MITLIFVNNLYGVYQTLSSVHGSYKERSEVDLTSQVDDAEENKWSAGKSFVQLTRGSGKACVLFLLLLSVLVEINRVQCYFNI